MPIFLLAFVMTFLAVPVWAADIVSTRFALLTDRYDHCVLGDCIEYGAVEAVLDDGRILSYRLDENSVFEDVEPRLVPMGLNGRKAILVVRSYQNKGAALALLDQRGGKLVIAAESEPIGLRYRWQNPIGVGDFDRDRKLEIATVITPHIGGRLTLYERQGNKLVEDVQTQSFSNHKMGSSQLDLHEVIDWNKDGIMDIVVPDMSRGELQVLSFVGAKTQVIDKRSFSGTIGGPIVASETGLLVGLEDGNQESWPYPH
ncbi:exported hypothetical protein [Candidatus Terasakiella magnetica]|uniref:FG-GAP repeat protein n=1 Tax=Candidatus Terasakiella magnetica TaxID=1867952 RepID=A0A1C3RIC4_9PROT|nr:VCBS repeat-containing protein [Candidatus Terasakiella magnetica]SCA57019.1 exported hypothetical protein [Candidatus Terasakiella magnetica]